MMNNILRVGVLVFLFVGPGACAGRRSSESGDAPAKRSEELAAAISRLALVSDSAGIAKKIRAACSDPVTRSSCYESALVPVAADGKVKLAMGSLAQLALLDPEVRGGGHVYAHAIGIAAGGKTSDVAGAFSQCPESFQSGCYHGVIQAWFARLDSIGRRDANALCEPFRATETQRWIRFQCVHGMGHGLTMLYRHDLRAGLGGCDLLNDDWDRHACYGGAFMENIVNVTTPHHPAKQLARDNGSGPEHEGHHATGPPASHATGGFKAVDSTDAHYPCSALASRYLRACYEMQTSVMLFNNGGDIATAAKSCAGAPRNMRTVCYASLGRDISSYSEQKHAEAIRLCGLGDVTYQPWCYFGVVKNLIDINARASEGLAFCRDVPGDANKQVCHSAAGEQIGLLAQSAGDRRRLCDASDAGYADACLYGARVTTTPPEGLVRVWRSID